VPILLNVSNIKQVFALLYINKNSLKIGCVYLPHLSSLTVVESHLFSVENFISNNKPYSIIVCGGYNIPHINWSPDELGLSVSEDFNPVFHAIVD